MSLRDIRQKIKGVTSTRQITNAMRMMSTAKLNKARDTVQRNLEYVSRLTEIVRGLRGNLKSGMHPAFQPRESIKSSCLIVLGGERGLCGSFNAELQSFAEKCIKDCKSPKKDVIVFGKKTINYLKKLGIPIKQSFETLSYKDGEKVFIPLCKSLYKQFLDGEYDEIVTIYSSVMKGKEFICKSFMPLEDKLETDQTSQTSDIQYEYDPSPEVILDKIMPKYIYLKLLMIILDSSAAEQRARMTAMTSATDRAGEIADDLQLQLNRSRQALITREINEVISGAQL